MYNQTLPIPRAFKSLMDLVSDRGGYFEKSIQTALRWIAAGRMQVCGKSANNSIFELLNRSTWLRLIEDGIPIDDLDDFLRIIPVDRGVEILRNLYSECGDNKWDVLPTLEYYAGSSRDAISIGVIGEVYEVMLDMLDPPIVGDLWIPFDPIGALCIRALRRGYMVNAVSMSGCIDDGVYLKLLLAIEFGVTHSSSVQLDIKRELNGFPLTTAEQTIAIPPFGVKLAHHSRLYQWNSSNGKSSDQFDRSETMVIHELLKRIKGRSIFLVPSGFLFSRRQDQILREQIVHRGGEDNDLESIVSLPPGVLFSTKISTAIMVVGRSRNIYTRFVDLGINSRTAREVEDIVRSSRDLILGRVDDPSRSCLVDRDTISKNDYIFAPSRYLKRPVEVGLNAVSLSEICIGIKPPVLSKSDDGDDAFEIGIPDLGLWVGLTGPFDKKIKLKRNSSDLFCLMSGDIILSIKGTVGKSGVLGEIGDHISVCSQSCIGLRIKSDNDVATRILPGYLLLFIRSEIGQSQLESLKVGAAVQHINLKTLMDSFMVPLPNLAEQTRIVKDYENLVRMENEISSIYKNMSDIEKSRWTVQS